jgi:catechol 2,3-dioxygenase-like lactoylglutathione lyase family enzyme
MKSCSTLRADVSAPARLIALEHGPTHGATAGQGRASMIPCRTIRCARKEVSFMSSEISFGEVIPILRIFDVAKADEFYGGYLGFKVDWEHRFDDHAPLYRQISRDGLILHLSEHHGDGSPGVKVRISMRGVRAFHDELHSKDYRYMRPGLEKTAWKTLETCVIDPSGNQLRFYEPI